MPIPPNLPRRAYLELQSPAERAIGKAMFKIETMAGDPLLTEAVELLGQAKNKVGDYVDRKLGMEPRQPLLGAKP